MAHKKVYGEVASQKEKEHFEKFLSEDEELVIATGFGHTFLRHQFIYYKLIDHVFVIKGYIVCQIIWVYPDSV